MNKTEKWELADRQREQCDLRAPDPSLALLNIKMLNIVSLVTVKKSWKLRAVASFLLLWIAQ